ncbi:MAG: hypothetical protein GF334_02230 [Candidatus Altiarchaeales archaeon]|nr:hypothetical protein [Candidatus Altiarchaeales archaeon]
MDGSSTLETLDAEEFTLRSILLDAGKHPIKFAKTITTAMFLTPPYLASRIFPDSNPSIKEIYGISRKVIDDPKCSLLDAYDILEGYADE